MLLSDVITNGHDFVPTVKLVSDMMVVLYLDDFDQPSLSDGCCPSQSWSMSPGVRVAVHDQQVPPDMSQSLAVGPGTEMNVQITQFDRQRLSAPYGNCTTRTQLGSVNDSFGYSSVYCEELCLQDIVSIKVRKIRSRYMHNWLLL
jgi:Amiloride-sensitive sodium channel